MSKSKVIEFFGDGEKAFDIAPGHWDLFREYEDKHGSAIAVFHRLRAGHGKVDEIRDVIRLGLIGGGATPQHATTTTARYFDRTPLADSLPLAITILGAGIFGAEVKEAADGSD